MLCVVASKSEYVFFALTKYFSENARMCSQTWEKVNIVDNENGTLSFNQKRVYVFSDELSNGSEDDVVIVPNIPMLSATSQSKHAAR